MEVGRTGDRYKTFQMKNGVAIYGGFAGTETALGERDVQNNETILSGDIGTPVETGDNCYHVFYHPYEVALDATAVLDGFSIIAGNANGTGNHLMGGGMYNSFSSPTVTGCTFGGNSAIQGGGMYNAHGSIPKISDCFFPFNSAVDGGGMYNNFGSPTVSSCTFSRNSADGRGGGMYNSYYSSPKVSDCTLIGNSAAAGGGMYNLESTPTVAASTFMSNSADDDGGGMYNFDCNPQVTGCTLTGNSAGYRGGGMFNDYYSSPVVSGCIFVGNSAGAGGGMDNSKVSNPTVSGCTFVGNSAAYRGGGMHNYYSSPTVSSCTFTTNSSDKGGGISNSTISSPTISNCTFISNSAQYGGGVFNRNHCNPIVTNCILWHNTASSAGNEICNYIYENNDHPSIPLISYSDIAVSLLGGSWDPNLGSDGGGNIDADPCFVDANGADVRIGTEDDNLRLSAASPCIDAGENRTVKELTDFDGMGRILDGDGNGIATSDMGAYEYKLFFYGEFVYVDHEAKSGANNGLSWEDAYLNLHAALFAAVGDANKIWVAEGTYYPTHDYGLEIGDRGRHFRMINGVAIYGGFSGTETALDQRDVQNNETILSGDIGTPLETGDNCYHVFYHPLGTDLDATALLDGFTITAGNADGSTRPHYKGGGMFNYWNCSPTVSGCTFSNNLAFNGGGMFQEGGSPELVGCTFTGNIALYDGGGMHNLSSSPTVTDCTFGSNSADRNGGGMYNDNYSNPKVTGCTFTDNSADYGGGMDNFNYSEPTVIDSTFGGNLARHGGGMYNSSSSPVVSRCTFAGNSAIDGGGMYNLVSSNPQVTGCTFTGNLADSGGGMYNYYYSSPTVTGCTFGGNQAIHGNSLAFDSTGQRHPITIQITNSIFWDGSYEILHNEDSNITITYSDIQGGWPGLGNINVNPQFVEVGRWIDSYDPNIIASPNDPNAVWIDGDYRLSAGSPCIDMGDPNYVPGPNYPTDLDGNPRVMGERIDMGAYEFSPFVEVAVKFTPGVLNTDSQGQWVKVHCTLAEGYSPNDVDINTPAVCDLPGGEVYSEYINVSIDDANMTSLEIAFDRVAFDSVTAFGATEVTITGKLTDGYLFTGSDTIILINKTHKHIKAISENWLWQGERSGNAGDINGDGSVDFADFARLGE
jgi:hypothetical protein